MDLLKTYANNCGIKVNSEPSFPECYFPSPQKYITVHNGAGLPSKVYDYYSEAIALISTILDREGIQVVQVGVKEETPVEKALLFNGGLSLRQSAYLVKNSLCHVGNDSFWAHYAGANRVPLVALYGPTDSKTCGPSVRGDVVLINSHRNGNKISHAGEESPKTINFIKPESVARAILKMLNLKDEINHETLFIGSEFHRNILEVIPDCKISPSLFSGQVLNVRGDLYYSEDNIVDIARNYQISLSIKQPINLKKLEPFRQNIKLIMFYLNESETPKSFIKDLNNFQVPYNLIYNGKSEDDLSDKRLKLFDFNPVLKLSLDSEKPNILNLKRSSWFTTKKLIFSNGNIYFSPYHREKNIAINNSDKNKLQFGQGINSKDIWFMKEHLYIFNQE